MITMRVDSSPLIAGSLIVGDVGLGVEGINIPTTGTNGASVLAQYVTLPADNDAEFRLLVTTPPSTGELFVYENGSFIFEGGASNSESFDYSAYKDGALIESGSVGLSVNSSDSVTINVTESGPSFTEIINSTLTAQIDVTISSVGPSFAESVSATLTSLTLNAAISESGPSFTESITAESTTTVGIALSVNEAGPSFVESVLTELTPNVEAVITEQAPSFSESSTISVTKTIEINTSELGPSFTEYVRASIPVIVTANYKFVSRVKSPSIGARVQSRSTITRVK